MDLKLEILIIRYWDKVNPPKVMGKNTKPRAPGWQQLTLQPLVVYCGPDSHQQCGEQAQLVAVSEACSIAPVFTVCFVKKLARNILAHDPVLNPDVY